MRELSQESTHLGGIVALGRGTTVALLRRIITLALLLLLAIVITTAVLVVGGTTVMRHDVQVGVIVEGKDGKMKRQKE
jgi:hypothetical protein